MVHNCSDCDQQVFVSSKVQINCLFHQMYNFPKRKNFLNARLEGKCAVCDNEVEMFDKKCSDGDSGGGGGGDCTCTHQSACTTGTLSHSWSVT